MLEYISCKNEVDEGNSLTSKPVYVYMGKDSMQYAIVPQNMLHWSFSDETHNTYHYLGHGIIDENSLNITPNVDDEPITIKDIKNELIKKESNNTFDIVENTNYLDFRDNEESDPLLGNTMSIISNKCCVLLKDKLGRDGVVNLLTENSTNRPGKIHYDKIRIHILQGYTFNNLGGFMLQVRAKISDVYRDLDKEIADAAKQGISEEEYRNKVKNIPLSKHIHDYITLLDYFMPKEMVKDEIEWQLNEPLYINSKFFDRYIEINVPSPYDLGKRDILGNLINDQSNIYTIFEDSESDKIYYGSPDTSANVVIRYAPVQTANISYMANETDLLEDYECNYTIDPITEYTFKYDSSADNFNAQIELDETNQKIYYYPTYRIGKNDLPISIRVMQGIETNVYPMFDYAEYDDMNSGIDEFLEMYGEDAFTWIVINELSATYEYTKIIDTNHDITTDEYQTYVYTDYFTNTVDYTGKTESNGEFWKQQFIPNLKTITNFTCNNITLKYTCHLYNRLNNRDIMRTATMNIPTGIFARTHVSINNVIEYKVVNKIVKSAGSSIIKKEQKTPAKLTKHFYDVTNVVVSSGNNNYPQGKYTLYLNHTSSNYMFKLYVKTDNNVNVPFDLSGPYTYMLRFPTTSIGDYITLKPHTDAENYNPQMGQLIFYITDTNVRKIMDVPESDRFFSIIINQNDSSNESTLYEGKVAYFNR